MKDANRKSELRSQIDLASRCLAKTNLNHSSSFIDADKLKPWKN